MDRKTITRQALLYGLLFGLFINLIQPLLLPGTKSYTGSNLATLVFFSLLLLSLVLLFRSYSKNAAGSIRFSNLFLMTIVFSVTTAVLLGLGHYINATFIDPEWAQKALEASQEKWAANNYSEEAIAGQTEWISTFQNPATWALSSAFMITLLAGFIGVIIALIYYVRFRIQNIDTIPQV